MILEIIGAIPSSALLSGALNEAARSFDVRNRASSDGKGGVQDSVIGVFVSNKLQSIFSKFSVGTLTSAAFGVEGSASGGDDARGSPLFFNAADRLAEIGVLGVDVGEFGGVDTAAAFVTSTTVCAELLAFDAFSQSSNVPQSKFSATVENRNLRCAWRK